MMHDDRYTPPGSLSIIALAELLMRQEGWGWSRALYEAMCRRERRHAQREQERQRQRRRSRDEE